MPYRCPKCRSTALSIRAKSEGDYSQNPDTLEIEDEGGEITEYVSISCDECGNCETKNDYADWLISLSEID